MGAVRNAQLAPVTYPGWTLRFYCETPPTRSRFGAVPARLFLQWSNYAEARRGLVPEIRCGPTERLV